MQPKFVCPQHTSRKPYLSPHHTLATSVVLVFSYYGQLSGLFRSFLIDNFRNWPEIYFHILAVISLPDFSTYWENPIDQSAGKVRENKSLATSLSTWQTKDYYFNGKFYLKTLNAKKTWWSNLLYISNIYFLMMINLREIPATCESQKRSLGAILTWSTMAKEWPAV